MINQTR